MERYEIDQMNWETDVGGHGLRHTVCEDYFEFPWEAKRHLCQVTAEEEWR